MMKQTSLLLLVFACSTTLSFSQDIITTKKGEDILAKISEISKTEVKYKLFDSQDGRIYTLPKSDILMIRYENGSKDIFSEEPKNNPAPAPNSYNQYQRPPVQADPEASAAELKTQRLFFAGKAEKYKRMKGTGASLTVLGVILFTVGVGVLSNVSTYYSSSGTSSYSGNAGGGTAAFLIGAGCMGGGIPLWIVGAHNHRKYEKKLAGLSFRLNVTPQGQGLTLNYRFH